jgi:RNA-directed DNA polymerase
MSSNWRPQPYRKLGQSVGADPTVLDNAIAAGTAVIAADPGLPPVFTLHHLAALTGADYDVLRAIVCRARPDPYRVFSIRKSVREQKETNYRIICVPTPDLMRAQRWIARRILARGRPHWASYAYAPGSEIKQAAALHCGCTWLIKLDVQRFFESVSEIAAYRVFIGLGYGPLIAFEMARICTRTLGATRRRRWWSSPKRYESIPAYQHPRLGHLPQGAPTSPMLSNLALVAFDQEAAALAQRQGLVYSRYADDLSLSTTERAFTRERAARVIGEIYRLMGGYGLSPNRTKTKVIPPGARKTVLGLLVDGDKPRLSREFRSMVRQHLYYLTHPAVGPAKHAQRRGFASVYGLKNHVIGLVRFSHSIDPSFATDCKQKLSGVEWPP